MVTVREALISDAEAIHVLGETVPEFSVNDTTVNFWPQSIIETSINSDDVIVLVAEDDANLVGLMITNLNKSLRKALIENVFVKLEKRDQGVADDMLAKLLELLEARDYEYVATLVPHSASKAYELYQNSGFTKGEQFVWLDMPLTDKFQRKA